MESIIRKEWCLFYNFINWYIVNKLYYWKMFDLVILIIVDITSQILFHCLIESLYLSVRLKIKGCKKFTVHSEFYNEYYKEPKDKSRVSIYYKLIWQSIITDDLSDDDIREIFCWMRFVSRYELAIFDKTIHCNEDTVITGIVNKISRLK